MKRAGLFDGEAVARIEAYRRERGLSPVEAVLQMGLVDETRLADFLQSKMLVPRVTERVLEHLDQATVANLPAELAWMHSALVVSIDDAGNLTLAMADPTDLQAVEAVAAHTGAYLVRAVAPLTPLRTALERYYGPRPPVYRGPPTPHHVPAAERQPEAARPLSAAAFANLLPELVSADDRDEIMQVLLDFLAEGFDRVILFIHLRNQIRGRDARGNDLLLDAVTQVRIPTTGPSHFLHAIESREPYFGPWTPDARIDAAFARALGGIEGEALVLPIVLRDKVPLIVFAAGPMAPLEPQTVRDLATAVSQALERLIFRKKQTGRFSTVG